MEIRAPVNEAVRQVLTPEAAAFIVELVRRHREGHDNVLLKREQRKEEIKRNLPKQDPESEFIRNSTWSVTAPVPLDLQDRRTEITGPVERKMMINALNSGAQGFMADFEDALSPTWNNIILGQINCMDSVRGTISYTDPRSGKKYELKKDARLATLLVRPRGLHLYEAHVTVDGRPVPASIFDFGLYLFHNGRELLSRGSGPYLYLPKMENGRIEARLWADMIRSAESLLGLPSGCTKVTVLIETILAALEMNEIIYELRPFIVGMNAGRWDYLFSVVKKLGHREDCVLPDRALVTMASPFMEAYCNLLVKTAHYRGVHAMGGMSAVIPSRTDAKLNEAAFAKVIEDKEREARLGFDGAWAAHPDLVPVVSSVFDRFFAGRKDQKHITRDDVAWDATPLVRLSVPGHKTEAGARSNITVALQYTAHWLNGSGAVGINNLMEDAATAEFSRALLWQWIRHGSRLNDGRVFNSDLYRQFYEQELEALLKAARDDAFREKIRQAGALLNSLVLTPECPDFLTTPAYNAHLVTLAAPTAVPLPSKL